MCRRLEYVRAYVGGNLDLAGMPSLRMVDLTFDRRNVARVELPTTLVSCRFQVLDTASCNIITNMLALLPAMRNLRALAMYTDWACILDLDSLPPKLNTIVVSGAVYIDVLAQNPSFPDLEVLGLHKCKTSSDMLAGLLQRKHQPSS